MAKWLSLLGLVTLQLSCASALKKQCESTNWFQHGHTVAMTGRRLDADDFAARCEKEGVQPAAADMDLGFKSGMQNYCKPDIVYSTGKEGNFFSDDFCEPGQLKLLKKKHAEGVREHCQAENGHSVGASGKVYNNICPKELEKAFIPRYRKGRKVYLGNEVLKREQQIQALDNDIDDYDRQKRTKSTELALLASRPKRQEYVTTTNPDGSHATTIKAVEEPHLESQISSLRSDLGFLDSKIGTARTTQKKLREEMIDLKTQANALEE